MSFLHVCFSLFFFVVMVFALMLFAYKLFYKFFLLRLYYEILEFNQKLFRRSKRFKRRYLFFIELDENSTINVLYLFLFFLPFFIYIFFIF